MIVEASTGYGPGSPFSLSCAEGLASSSCNAYENRVEFTRAQSASGTFDVATVPQLDTYQDRPRVRLRLLDWRPAEPLQPGM